MYAWVESTHVLTLMVFLGMLFIIDLRMLGFAFTSVPASTIAERLDLPMKIGMTVMVLTGFVLFFAIPGPLHPEHLVPHESGADDYGAIVNALIFRREDRWRPGAAAWDR